MSAETPTPLEAVQKLFSPLRDFDDQLDGPLKAFMAKKKVHIDAIEAIRVAANAQIKEHIEAVNAAQSLLTEQCAPLIRAQIALQVQLGIAVLNEANTLENTSWPDTENTAIFIPKPILEEAVAQTGLYDWTQKLIQETMQGLGIDEAGGVYLSKEDSSLFEQDQVNQNQYTSIFKIIDGENICELEFELNYAHTENPNELDEVPMDLSIEFSYDDEDMPEDFPADPEEIGEAAELWNKHMHLHDRLRFMFVFLHAANRTLTQI